MAIPEKVDLSKYVEVGLMGSHPPIRGRRLPISFIASAAQSSHLTITELSREFGISEEQVLAALLYYREHQTEIDAQEVEDREQWDAMREQYGKKTDHV